MIWTLIDTTERHQAETALAAERVRLTAIIDRFPAGVWVDDEDGHIVLINQNLCDLLEVNDVPTHLVGQVQRQLLSSLPKAAGPCLKRTGARARMGIWREKSLATMGARWKWTSSRLPTTSNILAGCGWCVTSPGKSAAKPFWKPWRLPMR